MGKFSLTESERLELHGQFDRIRQHYLTFSPEDLLSQLKEVLEHSSWQAVKTHYHHTDLDHQDLAMLMAYFSGEFLPQRSSDRKVEVEVRVEDDSKLYVLGSLSESHLPADAGGRLTWVHSEGWALERFVNKRPGSGPYLCGGMPERSKFVSLAQMTERTTKEEALRLLGLKGYEAFDRPGPLYVVNCVMTGELRGKARPMVPLIYKTRGAEDRRWKMADNFGVATVPGFTSGGSSEVVISTFEVEADDLLDLQRKGVECRVLLD